MNVDFYYHFRINGVSRRKIQVGWVKSIPQPSIHENISHLSQFFHPDQLIHRAVQLSHRYHPLLDHPAILEQKAHKRVNSHKGIQDNLFTMKLIP